MVVTLYVRGREGALSESEPTLLVSGMMVHISQPARQAYKLQPDDRISTGWCILLPTTFP